MVEVVTILVIILMFALVACIVYIAIIGKIGIQFFRNNMPFMRRRGCWYLILQKDMRYKVVYDKFKENWKWADGTFATIRRKFERIAQTAEPLIFLVEGYSTNAILFEELPKEEQSKQINNIIKLAQANERLKAQDQYQIEKQGWMKHLPLITAVMVLITAALTIAIFVGMNDVKAFVQWAKPLLEEAIVAMQAQPKSL